MKTREKHDGNIASLLLAHVYRDFRDLLETRKNHVFALVDHPLSRGRELIEHGRPDGDLDHVVLDVDALFVAERFHALLEAEHGIVLLWKIRNADPDRLLASHRTGGKRVKPIQICAECCNNHDSGNY